MVNRFAKQFRLTAAKQHLRQFGESVPYYFGGRGTPREVTATVIREDIQIIAEIGEVTVPSIIVSYINSETEGVRDDEINVETDRVMIATDENSTPRMRQVVKILSSSSGMVRLLIQ